MMQKFLTDREFAGIIDGYEVTSTAEDPENRGRYKVLIPELMYSCYDDEQAAIFCTNQVTKYRNGYCNVGSGIYGQYFPLHPGTKVVVKFFSEDFDSGYIDRIVGDYHQNSLPLDLAPADRDQYYQILRTINNDLIAITANTTSNKVPPKGIHIYHNKDNVVLVCDENGIHIYSKKDLDIQIDGNCNINVKGECWVDATFIKLNCGASKTEKTKTITFDEKKTPNVEF